MQIATQFRHLVLVSLVLTIGFQGAWSKSTTLKKVPGLSAPLTPIFDTSLEPKSKYFQLKVERKQLLYLKDSSGMLQGHTGVYDLHSDAHTHIFKARVAKDIQLSIMQTVEHDVKPKFFVDLRKLEAVSAPDVTRLMETEIAQARRKVAGDVAKQENVMNAELQSEHPRPDALPMPTGAGVKPVDVKTLESEAERSRQRGQEESQTGAKQLEKALPQAREPGDAIPAFPNVQAVIPQGDRLSKRSGQIPKAPEIDTSTSEKQMAAELRGSGRNTAPDSELNAELNRAQKLAKADVSHAQPAMDTVLTSLRTIPSLRIPKGSDSQPAEEPDATEIIEWDKWHAQFAELARGPILKALNQAGNPSGSDTVAITVRANRKVSVELTVAGSFAFDKAILQAYRTLDGNSSLAFPAGSSRSEITFLIDNKHTGNGTPSSVKSQTSVGDKELVRKPR